MRTDISLEIAVVEEGVNPYRIRDLCNNCLDFSFPSFPCSIEVDKEANWVTARYKCRCGYEWTCGWSLDYDRRNLIKRR